MHSVWTTSPCPTSRSICFVVSFIVSAEYYTTIATVSSLILSCSRSAADHFRISTRAKRRGKRYKQDHQFLCHFSVPSKSFSVYSPASLQQIAVVDLRQDAHLVDGDFVKAYPSQNRFHAGSTHHFTTSQWPKRLPPTRRMSPFSLALFIISSTPRSDKFSLVAISCCVT